MIDGQLEMRLGPVAVSPLGDDLDLVVGAFHGSVGDVAVDPGQDSVFMAPDRPTA